jgi:hypothetical protein
MTGKKLFQTLPGIDSSNFPRRNWMVQLLLLATWVVFQFWVGNRVYALFMIVFFLALSLLRPPNFILLAIPVLILLLFNTQTINSLVQLRRWNLNAVQDYKHTLLELFTPNSGQEVLPDRVRQMLQLLQKHHIEEYRLSSQLAADMRIQQRIVESAWPVREDASSPHLLGSIEEIKKDPSCTVVDQEKDVALAYCN